MARPGLDPGGVDGEVRVEQVGEADAQRLRGQPEQMAVAVEREAAGRILHPQTRFVRMATSVPRFNSRACMGTGTGLPGRSG